MRFGLRFRPKPNRTEPFTPLGETTVGLGADDEGELKDMSFEELEDTFLSGPIEKVGEDSFGSFDGLGTNENAQNLEFGRDTNRLDLFSVAPFDVHWDDGFGRSASYGGGSVGVVSDDNTRQVPVGIFANGSGARRGHSAGDGEVVIQRLDHETASAGAGGSKRPIGGEERQAVGRRVLPRQWWKKYLPKFKKKRRNLHP